MWASIHLPDSSDCLNLNPSSALSYLYCSVACSDIHCIIIRVVYYAFIYYCGEQIKIRNAGTCELKGIRYYIDYSQASLTITA